MNRLSGHPPRTRVPARGRRLALSLLTVLLVLPTQLWSQSRPTSLPRDHSYQGTLRSYIGSLGQSDFEIELKPLQWNRAMVEDENELHRLWLLFSHQQLNSLPSAEGLRLSPDQFLLSNIETANGIMMRAGGRGGQHIPGFSIQPADTAWWALWDFEGNPYRGSRAVLNRAFVVAAVDMMMLDHLHESGTHWVDNARRSDFLGGTMVWLTYVYWATRDHLPRNVQRAYETGLGKFMDRLTEWGPTGVNDNMDTKAVVAMAYIEKTLPGTPLARKARAYANRVLERVHAAGMIRDAGGLDASYNGIALYNLIWGTAASEWPEFIELMNRMHDLKGHLTLPEPDRSNFFGPSHFSTRTGHGSPTDQWSASFRDPAAAMITDRALYLLNGGRRGRTFRDGFPHYQPMGQDIGTGVDLFNARLRPSTNRFTVWEAGWWPGRVNYAYEFYRPDFYDHLLELYDRDDPILLPPFARKEHQFIRVFPDPALQEVPEPEKNTFLSARFSHHGAIAYTGPIGWTPYMNFAGGGLSAFWTEEGGSIVLGRTGHPVEPETTRQEWKDWRLWPTHAISGQTRDGHFFSSARIRRRVSQVEYRQSDQQATIHIRSRMGANIDDGKAVTGRALSAGANFERSIDFNEEGITVYSALEPGRAANVAELYEIIPLFIEDAGTQRGSVLHQIHFQIAGEWIEADDSPHEGVSAIRVKRFEGGALIEFEHPQRARLSPSYWEDNYQSRATLRNVMLDLLTDENTESEGRHAVRYRLRNLLAPAPPPITAGAIARALRDGSRGLETLRQLLQEGDDETRASVIGSLSSLGSAGAELLRIALRRDPLFANRHLALTEMAASGSLHPQDFTTQVFPDGSDTEDPGALLVRWGFKSGAQALPFLEYLFPVDLEEERYRPRGVSFRGAARAVEAREGVYALDLPSEMAALDLSSDIPDLSPRGPFTLELWIQATADQGSEPMVLVDKMAEAESGRDYQIRLIPQGESRVVIEARLGFGSARWHSLTSAPVDLPPEEWRHLAVAYNGQGRARLVFQRDVVAEETWSGVGPVAPGIRNLLIGGAHRGEDRGFSGQILGVRLHARDLTGR